jgi:hypothetical protein
MSGTVIPQVRGWPALPPAQTLENPPAPFNVLSIQIPVCDNCFAAKQVLIESRRRQIVS